MCVHGNSDNGEYPSWQMGNNLPANREYSTRQMGICSSSAKLGSAIGDPLPSPAEVLALDPPLAQEALEFARQEVSRGEVLGPGARLL